MANYYAPNDEGSQNNTLSVMNENINQLDLDPNTAIVWGGDFNLIFDTNLDANGSKPQLNVNSLSQLLSITEGNDLCDIFRVRCPNEKRFTWRRKNLFKQRGLDYFLTGEVKPLKSLWLGHLLAANLLAISLIAANLLAASLLAANRLANIC